MHETSRASTVRHPRRLLFWAPAVAALAAAVSTGACHGEDSSSGAIAPFSGVAQSTGSGTGSPTQNTSGSANPGAVNTGSTASNEGTNTDIALTNGSASAPVAAGSGGASSTTPDAPKPCVDTPAPYRADWPEATCQLWATQTTECGNAWFATYCDISCGRCTPQGMTADGTAGSAGSSGMQSATPAPVQPTVDCSGAGLPNVTGGDGYATRYWDCCQPACAQNDGHRCSEDGVTKTGNNSSSCSGGGSYACYDEAPHAVSDCLSYGYIAKANPNCGGCYRIQFTGEGYYDPNEAGSNLIKGKQMIVKVSNTGSDVANNQFDLMIPGGGVGLFNACSKQWGTSDLGMQYGGFLASCTGDHATKKECVRQDCMKIPAGPARDGCLWFVDWLEVADDPKFTSQAVACPSDL